MNKKIATRTGIITGFLILAYVLTLSAQHVPSNSKLQLVQFLFLFFGIFTSVALLFRYYADIKFIDAFSHGMKTLATILTLVIFGNCILFLVFAKGEPWADLTLMIMKTIFAYSVSGLFSTVFSSFIFNTFTKK